MIATLETAGEVVAFDVSPDWVADLVAEAAAGAFAAGDRTPVSMRVIVERNRRPFPTASWQPLGRNARTRDSDTVIDNVAGSGFDMLVRPGADPALFVFRRRPSLESRVLRASRSRFVLRARAALTQYPPLWHASVGGRAPLHAACFEVVAGTALVAGGPGAGKSTALAAEVAAGRRAVCDNLCVAGPATVFGVVEPVRLPRRAAAPAGSGGGVAPAGRPTTHGRVETPLPRRMHGAVPDLVVVLRRGQRTGVRDIAPAAAARVLVASTFACGELRRFWPLAALLAMGTGAGPALPGVHQVAHALTQRLPCVEVSLERPGELISSALIAKEQGRAEVAG